MKNVARSTRWMTAGLLAGLLLTACATPGVGTPSPAVTVTVAAPTPSESPTPEPTASQTHSATAMPTASPSGPQVISVRPGAERRLTKSDAFSADGWQESSFQPVGRADAVQALGSSVTCRASGPRELEFRFAENQGTLTFEVAQAMSSPSSEESLEWALVVDGRQIETKRIAFKETAEFMASLTGVAVVKLQVKNPSPCSGHAIGLVTRAVIKG